MSRDGMARLEAVVQAAVTGAEGSAELAMAMLATELRTHRNLLLDALKELGDLGSQSRHRPPAAVDRARGLVNGVLRACGFHDRWPNLVPVAQGITDLMEPETQDFVGPTHDHPPLLHLHQRAVRPARPRRVRLG